MVTGIDASGLLSFLSEIDVLHLVLILFDTAEQNACSSNSDSDKSTEETVDSLSDSNIVDVPAPQALLM